MAASCLADVRAFRRGLRHLAGPQPAGLAGRAASCRARVGSDRLRRLGTAAERRHHEDERQPRRAADRCRARAGRAHVRAVAPRRRPAAGLGRIRGVARWCRTGHSRAHGRSGRGGAGRRHGPRVCSAVRGADGRAAQAAARPRPGGRHGRPVPRRDRGRAAGRRVFWPADNRSGQHARGPRDAGARRGRDAGAVHALRLRAEGRGRRGRRRVREHRAGGRRRRRRGGLRRPRRARTGRRRCRDPGRHRDEQLARAEARPGPRPAAARRVRSRRCPGRWQAACR